MASHIRLLGNIGAHGEAEMTQEDADQAFLFMQHYLDHIYVLPQVIKDAGVVNPSP